MHIHLFGLKRRVKAEFACWFPAGKLTKDQPVKMPKGLPTSESLPMPPQQNLISAPSTSVSTTNTIVINKETVLTSVCESLLSNSVSEASTSHLPKTIDLVVVPSAAPGSTTVTSTCQYKLSEIISREKEVLFQRDNGPDDELEPARQGVYSVRRRSRQFFTVTEEDENDTDTDHHTHSVETHGEKEKTVEVQPIFNLGDSLKKLYFPHQHKRPNKKKKRVFKKSSDETHHSSGYQSDPEGKIGLCDIIKNDPELKSYHSHPDLSWNENIVPPVDNAIPGRQSKSLPNTPRVSPKLLRRNSLKKDNQVELQKSGPGFSFLASVAGELHMKKLQQDKKKEQGVVKVNEGSLVAKRPSEPVQVIAQPQTMTSVSHHSEPSSEIHTHHMHDFSDSTGADLESHKPAFISSFMKWNNTKKINVTNKESNMFSPTSF
ncbi:uncharacterized protein LOC123546546 isoform X2 [Mercenaria mercenaria]|uniref:uncharacterized protein LOC123546546 isoform X2 n=1 Tax=Mercenaria mercenaria TaxID=6596 RepID=UPI001E1D29B7|nr:uncharacterized protein LOC123546546 isoform X2 [Mercenaria mercenaria]